jgi:hypothetical protein
VHQNGLVIHADVRLHPELPLIALLRPVHLRIAFAIGVLRRTRRAAEISLKK